MSSVSVENSSLVSLIASRTLLYVNSSNFISDRRVLSLKSELAVLHVIECLRHEGSLVCDEVLYSEGGHQFPDTVLKFSDGSTLGIEVKSSSKISNSWSILGNSVLGSTAVAVDDTYIILIKKSGEYSFDLRYAPYQDSIMNVVVSHSPRYTLDLGVDLAEDPSKNFFHRSGISYESMKNSSNPISLVTDYFRSQGRVEWWLGESNEEASSSATILSWNELEASMVDTIYGQAFVLFPEIISGPPRTKYNNLAKWLVARYSVADSSLRDRFSAGGTKRLVYNERHIIECAPKVYDTLHDHRENVKAAFLELTQAELQRFWLSYLPDQDTIEARKIHWYQLLSITENDQEKLDYVQALLEINIP